VARKDDPAQARVGTFVRKWRIDRLLDSGGMAAVFAATHRNGNRVAIKLLHPELGSSKEIRDRFLREGYVANKVGHPGAVVVLDDDHTDDGAVFLVMELLEGESLEERMRRTGPLTAVETLYVADQILDVLVAAHANGIVHRDIKPANVYVTTQGVIKLLDFGLARLRDTEAYMTTTRDGIVVGTVAFMAPEQAAAKTQRVDARADQWAVAALMFHLLTGRHVHEGKTMVEKVMAAANQPARSIRLFAPYLPDSFVALVDRALSFHREHRFPDTFSMQIAVRECYAEMLSTADGSSAPSSGYEPLYEPPTPMYEAPERSLEEIQEVETLEPDALEEERPPVFDRLAERTPVQIADRQVVVRDDGSLQSVDREVEPDPLESGLHLEGDTDEETRVFQSARMPLDPYANRRR